MSPRRSAPPRVTAELIAFHTNRGKALRRAAVAAALRALLRWLHYAVVRRR
ncbi:hypothetical protein [Rhodopseudomonas palustris]|uniref:hypothetical protein n=1 Tax=Rhodopseudomonas palustris TaxID=1076 RepID=UPI00163DB741|nr:hypothetical protein [Rhodopseudomonas palustris]